MQTIIDLHILDFVDPKAHLVAAGNVLLTAAQHLTGDATRLRDRINKNGSLSGDPAHDLALLDDLQSKVQSASTSAGTTLSTLGGLQASGFPDNGPALVAAQHAIQLARGTLVSAESNALAVRGDAR